MKSSILSKVLFILISLLCFSPFIKASFALLLGMALSFIFANPFKEHTKKWATHLLSIAIIGLGAGMNLNVIAQVGGKGIVYTIVGISSTFLLGYLIRKCLKVDKESSLLITVGTAICGGSAIAAVAPAIKAKSNETSIALGVVFLLNACALIIFPIIGHFLDLSQHQFGLWSALAIHDTSSVVGVTLPYGPEALQVGTTVKLTRALWIIPLTLIIMMTYSRSDNKTEGKMKFKIPWFIFGFIIMATLVTIFPSLKPYGHMLELGSKQIMVFTLFLIGSNLSKEALREVGVKSILFGIILWFCIGTATLISIYYGLIQAA